MSDEQLFKVNADGLNFRSAPIIDPENVMAVLHRGHEVSKIGVAEDENWRKVSALIHEKRLIGFVSSRYLLPAGELSEPPEENPLSAVHMRENDPGVTRNNPHKGAYPLGEPNRPTRTSSNTGTKAEELTKIVMWLDVERSQRYQPRDGKTYCNIYAYDYCYLAGVYLPRVWWTPKAIADGRRVKPIYDKTIKELTANEVCDWLEDFGPGFGWEPIFDRTELQDCANEGRVAVICAQQKDHRRSGHITAVVPETQYRKAKRHHSRVAAPLQSQAGIHPSRYGTRVWWTHDKYRRFGFWVNE